MNFLQVLILAGTPLAAVVIVRLLTTVKAWKMAKETRAQLLEEFKNPIYSVYVTTKNGELFTKEFMSFGSLVEGKDGAIEPLVLSSKEVATKYLSYLDIMPLVMMNEGVINTGDIVKKEVVEYSEGFSGN